MGGSDSRCSSPFLTENHLVGVTAAGLLGAGEELGQHEAARNAEAAAIKAIFIDQYKGSW